MARKSVEATKRKLLKRIEKLEAKQKKLIDKVCFDELDHKKRHFTIKSIHNISRLIKTCKFCIDNGYRMPYRK